MIIQVRRKIVQKGIRMYSENRITDWWNSDIVSYLHKHSHLGKQRYSKKKVEESFEWQRITPDKMPYYKVGKTTYNLILCPSGSFLKGTNDRDHENPLETIKIEKSFLLGETEITQELYEAVMGGKNPSAFQDDPKNPVEQVSWYDAVWFCNRLSKLWGLDTYYTITKDGKIIDTIETIQRNYVVAMNTNAKGFRLPTEWEWECAAKAGMQLKYSGSDILDEVGWHDVNSDDKTHEVKGKNPNAWGFYDMTGNVKEWCENTYDPNDTSNNPDRSVRGGAFVNYVIKALDTTVRISISPNTRQATLGFRVCRYV